MDKAKVFAAILSHFRISFRKGFVSDSGIFANFSTVDPYLP